MNAEKQQRLQAQMRRWAELTPEQRRIARENYKKLTKQPPEKREVVKRKWHEHQKKKTSAVPKSAPTAPAGSAKDRATPSVPPPGAAH